MPDYGRETQLSNALDSSIAEHTTAFIAAHCTVCLGTGSIYIPKPDGGHDRAECRRCYGSGAADESSTPATLYSFILWNAETMDFVNSPVSFETRMERQVALTDYVLVLFNEGHSGKYTEDEIREDPVGCLEGEFSDLLLRPFEFTGPEEN